jgi:hypothetical protein
LNGGEIDGVRLLSPKTVELMTVNHIGTLFPEPGLGFGLGFEVIDRRPARGLCETCGDKRWRPLGATRSTSTGTPKLE